MVPSQGCGIWECPPGEYLLYRVYDKSAGPFHGRGVSQLPESRDPEVMRYLEIARSCSNIRSQYDSKWYYPTKEHDVVVSSLEEVLSESLAYKGTQLKDRYALQAARAMFTLGRYRQMIVWWEEIKDGLKDEAIRNSIEGYVAGALFRTGEQDKALEYYTEIGDISSIVYCWKKKGESVSNKALLEYAAVHCPDNPDIIAILQDYITRIEAYNGFKENNEQADACYDMCMKAVRSSKNPAPWLYTAAFLKYQVGQPYVAANILARAEKCDASVFLKESMRVLRIMIDAQIYPYDKAYESRLLDDLKWLDSKIQDNITDNVKSETSLIYSLKFCYSYYYWNDMMRRLLLGTVCKRMIEAGKAPLALLLANYADNRLMMSVNQIEVYQDGQTSLVGLKEYRTSGKYFNNFDFSNHYFRLMNEAPLDYLVRYESLLLTPSSAIERFLQERCYMDQDYLKDIIGTRYIREQNYKAAYRYLSRVSEEYQKRLNTVAYMKFNPFETRSKSVQKNNTYKLDFVRKMLDYKHILQTCVDDDIKGEALIRIGLGMRASLTHCWALTHYGKWESSPWYEDESTLENITYAESIIEKGLDTIKDPELKARYYRDLYQWRTVVEKYPDTNVAKEIQTSCDNIVNYSYDPPKRGSDVKCVNLYSW